MDFFFHPNFENVLNLLQDNALPIEDLKTQDLNNFIGYGDESELGAIVGLELRGESALLRSFAVKDSIRKQGIGTQLVHKIEERARLLQVKKLFLITTTARKFFLRLGYQEIERDSLPREIRGTEEFTTLCPTSSSILMKIL
ncbi:hypothetical protein A0128_05645 [Leptospira tipperaryensis]|uniref:N-acetyltransferase domain-containing protein n=1 Tax=Leptospira tipperaryensis TaxID=2564040 RepID=A0A1D7UUU7_9LEPT|nr:hypothetical protein A0128_05645 [Leptospira tipperaryensis]